MILKIFTQPNCPKCPPAKKLGEQLNRKDTSGVARRDSPDGGGKQIKVEYYDISTADGLAEASFYSVMSTPSLILCDDQGKETKSWRGETPSSKVIEKFISR